LRQLWLDSKTDLDEEPYKTVLDRQVPQSLQRLLLLCI